MAEQTRRAVMGKVGAGRALGPLGIATALSLMGDATLYAVLPLHPAEAGIALGSVGIILSVNRIIRLATNGPAGLLFDRVADRRLLFSVSLWLGVLSTAIYALSSSLPLLFFGRLLWGLAWSGIWVGGNAIVLQAAPEAVRGRWVGIYQVWFFSGSALGSFLGGVLTDAVGYRQALWIGAAVSALGALAALGGLPDRYAANHPTHAVSPGWQSLAGWRQISSAMWAVGLAQGMNRLVTAGIVATTLGLVVRQTLGTELQWGAWQVGVASMTGGLLASRTLVSLLGAPLAGVWSDAVGRRWELLALSMAAGAIGVGLMAFPNLVVVIVGTILGAAASGSIQALSTALAGDLSGGKYQGSNLGILYTTGDLGSAIGPLAAYALLGEGGLPVIYIGSAVLMIVVAVWTASIR